MNVNDYADNLLTAKWCSGVYDSDDDYSSARRQLSHEARRQLGHDAGRHTTRHNVLTRILRRPRCLDRVRPECRYP